jgi:heme O synthase-like polyprenyltransferase
MKTVLLICGAALAAFCVWLTVQIVNRGERWAKRTAAAGMQIRTNRPLAIWLCIAAVVCTALAAAGGWPYGLVACSAAAVSNAVLAAYLWRHADEPIWRKQQGTSDRHKPGKAFWIIVIVLTILLVIVAIDRFAITRGRVV